MNKVELIGRICKEPELKLTANQKPYCNFTLAVDRKFKDANGQRQADFINCIAWNATAQFISKYFNKGSKIAICGSIQTRTYEKDGQKQYITEVFAEETEFVESTNTASQTVPATQNTAPADSDDLPFE